MMITPEMMEQLGGKRGKARGPDQSNVVIEESSGAADEYGGAGTLEDSVGDWDDGRKKKARKAKAKKSLSPAGDYDAAYAAFRAESERLQVTADGVHQYIQGLRSLCEGHDRVSAAMNESLGQIDALAEPVREYHEMSSWSRTSDPNSKASHMQEMMETMVLEPIVRHLETRRELEARLAKAKKKDHELLLDEMQTFVESLEHVMNSPFEALRRMQIDFMSEAARATGGIDAGIADVSLSTAMTARGRGLTGKTGFTPRPAPEDEEGVPPVGGGDISEGVPSRSPRRQGLDDSIFITAGSWGGPEIQDAKLDDTIPCLGLFAQLGWKDAEPTLFATLKNSSSLEIRGICVEVVQSSTFPVACKKPLTVARLAPGAEKRLTATLALGGAAASEPAADEFDSFFGERDETLEDDVAGEGPRNVESWAVDRSCTSLSVTLKLTNSLQATTVEVQLPYHLFLKGHSKLSWAEFLELWNPPEPQPEPQSEPTDYMHEPDDGTTKICVRIEDPPEILGYMRFDPDTNLDVMRQMLSADAAFNKKLPDEWVFVKKGAPVGKKAESKWRVADTVPNAVIRDKSRPLPDEAALREGQLQLRTASLSPAPSRSVSSNSTGRKATIPERIFFCPCGNGDAGVATALGVGGLTLVGRLEVDKDEVLLLFYARVIANVHLLLQVSCGSEDGRVSEACKCVVRGPRTDLFDVFEDCVRSLLGSTAGFVEIQRILGAGEPYYGDFGGVSFEDAQDGRGNDDGFEYYDYGDTSVEQMVHDWLTREGHGAESDGTCSALLEAGIPKGEWLQELIGIKQDGVLNAFVKSVNHHEEKKSRSAASDSGGGAGGYDYGDYGGASLEDAFGGADGDGYDYGDYGGASLEDALGGGGDGDGYDYGAYGGVSLEDAIGGGDDWGGDDDGFGSGSGGCNSAPPSPMRDAEGDDVFDADFAAFDDGGGDGFGSADDSGRFRLGQGALTQNTSNRSLVSDGATEDTEAAFGAFEADFGDGDGFDAFGGNDGKQDSLAVSLQSGPDSQVFDADFVAEAERAASAYPMGVPSNWAAGQRPGFRSGRRGSTDSGGSNGSRRSSGGTSSGARSRPTSAPGTPRRITMMAGSGTVDQLEALSLAPASYDGGDRDEIGKDFDEDTTFYDEVSKTEVSVSRGSPTVSDYD